MLHGDFYSLQPVGRNDLDAPSVIISGDVRR